MYGRLSSSRLHYPSSGNGYLLALQNLCNNLLVMAEVISGNVNTFATPCSLDEVSAKEEEEEQEETSKDEQTLLPACEGISAKAIFLVFGKSCNLSCLGLESLLLSATDGTVPVAWQILQQNKQIQLLTSALLKSHGYS